MHRFALAATVLAGVHGLIHLIGFIAYWPLASVPDLAYKTTLLGSSWNLGAQGMHLYSVFWLVAAAGFALASLEMLTHKQHWRVYVLSITSLSLVITLLDWQFAFPGAVIDLIILAVLLASPMLAHRSMLAAE
ncbi:MAG: ABC transporter permease [Chloroflexota bacterium]